MANEKKTYLIVTANEDWQELGEAGCGATIWELPNWAADRLNEDPESIDETLAEHGSAIANFHKDDAGDLTIIGDVDQYVNDGAS